MIRSPDNHSSQSSERPNPFGERAMPLLGHLSELKKRLSYVMAVFVIAACMLYPFVEDIYHILSAPLVEAMGPDKGRFIFTSLPEVFLSYLKLSLYAALMVTFPWIAMQIWLFIAPGLYKTERRFLSLLLIATPLLFIAGVCFVYFVVLPVAWGFFLDFQSAGGFNHLPIVIEPKVDEYLSITMKLLFAFGLAFQLPILMILLNKTGLVSKQRFKRGRKYALIIVFILAAFLTPPDVISQLALAIPLLLLYETSLLFMKN